MDDVAAELAGELRAWLADELGAADTEVHDLRRLSGGSSRENWAFELGSARRPMLVRRDPVASVADTDRAIEVGVLLALGSEAVASPVVVAVDLEGACLERPAVVMERSPGRADRATLRSRDPLGLGERGRVALASSLAELLADVHCLDIDGPLHAVFSDGPADPAATEIQRWVAEIARVQVEPQPELAFVATWLWEHRPPPPDRTVLVHGDFRPANVLVDVDGQVSALLDWEFAHLGDPAEDLGWYTTPLYVREHFIADRWAVPDFLDRYQQRLGPRAAHIDPARLHFWEVLALFKLGAIALAGIASFLDGDTDRAAGSVEGLMRTVVAATRTAPRSVA